MRVTGSVDRQRDADSMMRMLVNRFLGPLAMLLNRSPQATYNTASEIINFKKFGNISNSLTCQSSTIQRGNT